MKTDVTITAIQLWREGDTVHVDAEVGGRWVRVIDERWDTPFSHIVEGLGIRRAAKEQGNG